MKIVVKFSQFQSREITDREMVQTRPASSEPVARLSLPTRAFCLSFSPFPHSSNLLAAGLQSSLTIGQCSFSEETSSGEFSWTVLQEIHHDTRVQALAWSPKSRFYIDIKSKSLSSLVRVAVVGKQHSKATLHENHPILLTPIEINLQQA